MLLCLDVGNSHIFGGVFVDDKISLRFRYDTSQGHTSDQIGIFLKNVLRENNLDVDGIQQISICSVVPEIDYSLNAVCIKYFNVEPFILDAKAKAALKISTASPESVGADLIASAIAATELYPNQNLIVVDFGTVTTYSFIDANKTFLGATFLPGFRASMQALSNAAKLFSVEIVKPESIMGQTTQDCMQAGLYYGQLAMLREVISRVNTKIFKDKPPVIIATGGFSHLLQEENLFSIIVPDLVLEGLRFAIWKDS